MQKLISQLERDELGDKLENLVQSVLSDILPIDGITSRRIPKKHGGVDFHLYHKGVLAIAIELKNWDDVKEKWIRTEIVPRFQGIGHPTVKLLAGRIPMTRRQIEEHLIRRNILFYNLPSQLVLKKQGMTTAELDLIDRIECMTKDLLRKRIALIILHKTGEYRQDFFSPMKVRIIGTSELRFESPDGKTKSFNLRSQEHTKRRANLTISDFVPVGDRELDVAQWAGNSDGWILVIPEAYEVYSESVDLQVQRTPSVDWTEKVLKEASSYPELNGLSDEEKIVLVSQWHFESFKRVCSLQGHNLDIEFNAKDLLSILKRQKRFGWQEEAFKGFKLVYWSSK